jgi:hypothetical protein
MSATTPPPSDSGADPAASGPTTKGGFGSALYKLALAGVGAVMIAQEGAFKSKSKEEADAPRDADGQTEQERAEGRGFAPTIDAAIGRVLRTLSIPTRDEVEALGKRIDELARAVDARRR